MKILIVEDASASMLLITKMLKALIPGASFSRCNNGRSALMMLSSEIDFDFIVLDLGLPDVTGQQILDFMKEAGNRTPVITISDEGNQTALCTSIDKGALDYLTKPLHKRQLKSVLTRNIRIPVNGGRKVLIVDDEEMNRLIYRKFMELEGYEVREASNGHEALRAADRETFDLVLMDVRMPYMDGVEASIHLRRDLPHLPIIVITGEDISSVRSRLEEEVEVDALIQKPIDRKVLMEQIASAMDNRRKIWAELLKFNGDPEGGAAAASKTSPFEDFHKFIPKVFLESSNITQLDRGLKREEECSIAFIDIRQFNALSENMSASQCFSFLNSFFDFVEPMVTSFGGQVYQFIGNRVVCTFPLHKGGFANNALHASVSIQDHLVVYNRGRIRAGYETIKVSCGISTGMAAFGVCGSQHRFGIGAFGAAMNVSSQSLEVCKELDIGIVITASTYDKVENPSDFLIRPIGSHSLKGMKEPVKLFEVFTQDHPALRSIKLKSMDSIHSVTDGLTHEKIRSFARQYPDDPLWGRLIDSSQTLRSE